MTDFALAKLTEQSKEAKRMEGKRIATITLANGNRVLGDEHPTALIRFTDGSVATIDAESDSEGIPSLSFEVHPARR
jgi:hypothetical protein